MSDITLKPCPYCGSDNIAVQMSRYRGEATIYYYALCGNCKIAGPEVSNEEGEGIAEEQAAEAWNALPRRLRWTRKPPTEPGWYWNRSGAWPPEILRLYYDSTNEFCYTVNGVGNCCWLVEELASEPGCAWAGPIPEPQEDK